AARTRFPRRRHSPVDGGVACSLLRLLQSRPLPTMSETDRNTFLDPEPLAGVFVAAYPCAVVRAGSGYLYSADNPPKIGLPGRSILCFMSLRRHGSICGH